MTEVVWLTSGYPWPGDTVGGIFFRAQAQALARAGLSIGIAAPVPAVPWPLPLLSARWRAHARAPGEQVDGMVRVVRPRFPNVPRQPSWAMPDRFIADAAWRTRRHWEGARLIHAHYSLVGIAARRLARRAGIPYVVTFHGGDLNVWPDLHPDRLDDLRATLRGAAAVFTVSRPLADRVRALAGVEAVHLPIGVDHQAIAAAAPVRAEARRQLDLPQDRFIVLYVGRLVPPKGVPELVAAALELGDPFLTVLVGPGPLAGLGMDDPRAAGRLAYAGPRSHDEVIRFMAAADVLILPSHTEGLPTVLVEAGSIGLPVIASAVGGIPDLLGDDRGVVLASVSSAAIRDALVAARDRPADTMAAGDRLRGHVHRDHDIDNNARRLIAWYRDIDPMIGGGVPAGDAWTTVKPVPVSPERAR